MKFKKLALTLAVALVAMTSLVPVAKAAEPAPGYSQFAGCPSPAEVPSVFACIRSEIFGGNFKMGNKNVPITNKITLSAGVDENTGALIPNAKGGLSPVKQKVPGGVIGLTGLTWLAELLGSDALTLYAVTEAAGQPFLAEENLSLPIKVHLVNPVLGNNCYVGSVSNPIKLNLTLGTTSPPPPAKPITGSKGETSFDPVTNIVHQKNMKYVDNAFSAPGASGCVLTLFGFLPINLNPLVNLQAGLPSAAGKNEAVQLANTELVASPFVYP